MMEESQEPLILCLENTNGMEVSVAIEPHDNFQIFLDKAKSLLGFDIDINSITNNQPVSLTDNIYQFLINTEQNAANELGNQTLEQMLDGNSEDLVYVLDDGTQIKASQIQFDNEDTPVDLTAEKIPFVKYADNSDDDNEQDCVVSEENTKKITIVGSPEYKWSNHNSGSLCSFVNSLPFRLVCNNTSNFEAQFTKYLQSSSKINVNPLTPVKNVPTTRKDEINLTREDVLNMFKDAPVTSVPYEEKGYSDKRKHVRKTDPSRLEHKAWNSKPVSCVVESNSQMCFICKQIVDGSLEKIYLFDNEDQKLHRCPPQRRYSTQLKIICEQCLVDNFKPCAMKSPSQSLKSDEYLIIKNNQQYIFQKVTSINLKDCDDTFIAHDKDDGSELNTFLDVSDKQTVDFVKVEIGSDGEIVTKSLYDDPEFSDDVVIVNAKDNGSSDVEIVEPKTDDVIEDLDEADEEVKKFLGKYQSDDKDEELKCRFCDRDFENVSQVIEHGSEHKHELEDGPVFPCPLCDYGYANLKWLTAHIKAAHTKEQAKENNKMNDINKGDIEDNLKDSGNTQEDVTEVSPQPVHSPVAKRTRSAVKKSDGSKDKNEDKVDKEDTPTDTPSQTDKATELANDSKSIESTADKPTQLQEIPDIEIKMEIKQEELDSSDNEIWILQTGDDDAGERLEQLLKSVKVKNEDETEITVHSCGNCNQSFTSTTTLLEHKCIRRRGRKRKPKDTSVFVPSKEDFLKKPRKKRNRQPTSDPQIVTCNDCNESFTSKVRLKFHMQFHEKTASLTSTREYQCAECDDAQFPTESELFDHVHFQHDKQKRQFHEKTTSLTSTREYQCAECDDAQFPTETELFDHVHFQHDKQKRWACPVKGCGKTFFLRATLTKHSRTHTDTRRYGCDTCGKRFLDKQTLDEHGVTHLQIKPFQCHICLKQLTRRSRLRMHLRAHEEELRPKLVLVCAVCCRAFRDQMEAQEHASKSFECIEEFAGDLKEESETVTEQLSPTSGVVRHSVRVVESPRFSKPIDREVVDTESKELLSTLDDAAKTIIRVVRIEKAFRCEYCEDVFYQEDALNSHRNIHKGLKNPFTCHICKVSFATYSRCTTHKTTHGFYKRSLADAKKQSDTPLPEAGPSAIGILGYGGFPVVKHFLCEDCGRSYLHWTYLQVHRRMKHANENFIFKCNHCDSTFPNSWSVAYHRKKVHGKTGQEEGGVTKIAKEDYRIPCRDCDEVLPNKNALYKHRQKVHSDGSLCVNTDNGNFSTKRTICSKCGHNFTQPEDLQKHLTSVHGHELNACSRQAATCRRIHDDTPDRPYPCDVCGVAFRRTTALRNHRLIHTSVRAFACARCDKRFRTRSDLKTHMRLKHPAHLVVVEMEGLNPTTEDVVKHLKTNNINQDNVLEVTVMSFKKGTSSVIPHSLRALSTMGLVPRTKINWKTTEGPDNIQAVTLSLDTAKDCTQELQGGAPHEQKGYPMALNVSEEALSALNVQIMLNESMMVKNNEMVQLQLDNMMLE